MLTFLGRRLRLIAQVGGMTSVVSILCAVVFWNSTSVAQKFQQPAPVELLLLVNGNTVEGVIRPVAGGYLVSQPRGEMLVPYGQVRLHAENLTDAYVKQRDAMRNPTATNHLQLAKWCLRHELTPQAQQELRDALRLEPQREEARMMLKRLERKPQNAHSSQNSADNASTPDTKPESQSLAGLSRESATNFVAKIQPMLLNKCGNGSCHGPQVTNGFRLTPIRRGGGHRVFAERNLAATLRHIDLRDPYRSPLLTLPRGNHGQQTRPVFNGHHGAAQYETLKQWVLGIAKEQEASNLLTNNDVGSEKANSRSANANIVVPASAVHPELVPTGRAAQATDDKAADEGYFEKLLRDKPADPFDPAAFNQGKR